jgi:hypothetical protein
MNIVIEIDALVLDGFDPADRFRIQAALERELTRLVHERGAAALSSLDPASRALDISSIESRRSKRPPAPAPKPPVPGSHRPCTRPCRPGNPGSQENPR